tara:strand:+ start:213 stop:470 length:258 start_codon:yes stop_codon:yes gene_type:complete
MNKYIMLLVAMFNTVRDMGPQYISNVLGWVKSALWNAPFRIFLDIELELLRLQRKYIEEPEEPEEPEEKPKKAYLSNLLSIFKSD